MRRWVVFGGLLFVGVGALSAQGVPAAAPAAVQGVVFDSVAGRPLAGASVQLAQHGSPSAPQVATTDAAGRYRLSAVAPGEYAIGFYSDALTDLGLDAPVRRVVVEAGTELNVDLAVPASRTIRTLRCGDDAPESSSGMLVGSVRDAQQRNTIAGATVRLAWKAFALDSGDYRVVTERTTATVESDGSLLACHLPIDAPLEVSVTAPGHRTVEGTLSVVPANGIARLELLLADTGATTGGASISGRVLRANGKPIASGRAVLGALGRDVPIQDGRFVIGNLPAGSWVVEARAIGVEPQAMLVTADEGAATNAQFALRSEVQALEPVTVVGKMEPGLRLLDEVLRRKRIGMGTTFLPGAPALRSAIFTSDVMREARGFQYRGPGQVIGRSGCMFTAVYIDDVLQSGGFADVDMLVRPSDVLAIETWPDIRLAPVQYRISKYVNKEPPRQSRSTRNTLGDSGDKYCAVVLIWTKQRGRF